MRKLIVVIALFVFLMPVMAQNTAKIDSIKVVQKQSDYTRHCLNRFRKEKQLSFKLMLGSVVLLYLASDDGINGYGKAMNDIPYHVETMRSGTVLYIALPRTNQRKVNIIKTAKVAGFVIGGGMALGGVALQVIPYRWMKRAYVGPDGIGIKYTF